MESSGDISTTARTILQAPAQRRPTKVTGLEPAAHPQDTRYPTKVRLGHFGDTAETIVLAVPNGGAREIEAPTVGMVVSTDQRRVLRGRHRVWVGWLRWCHREADVYRCHSIIPTKGSTRRNESTRQRWTLRPRGLVYVDEIESRALYLCATKTGTCRAFHMHDCNG